MNNEFNNNNNNLNGSSVLGSVNNTPNINNNPNGIETNSQVQPTQEIQPETLETLDMNSASQMNNMNLNMNNNSLNSQVLDNQASPNMGIPNSNVVMNNQQPVTPEPSYTNPQNINSMPGFENSSSIGTTPPISLEPENKPKKSNKNNKTLFVVIIILLLFGIGFGTYYILKYTNILNKGPKIEIVTKDLEINVGDKLSSNTSDYATITGTDVKNCSLNTLDVDVTREGIYNYSITCGEIVKSGKITVVDNTELVVNTKKVYKVKGETVEAREFIEDAVDSFSYEFIDSDTVNGYLNGEAGTYKVNIKVTAGTKNAEVEAELVIIEHEIKGYLVCESKEQNIANSSTVMTVKERFAIVDLDTIKNVYGNIANEEYTFKFTDETEYTNYLAKYKADNEITINNITGKAIFDNDTLTITITKDKTNSEVESEFGINSTSTYSSIRTYFTTTLGYNCTYERPTN